MFTSYLNSTFSSIQDRLTSANYFSDTTRKYAKIGGITLAIFASLTTLVFIYRHYKAKSLNSDDSVIPPHISPKLNPQKGSKSPDWEPGEPKPEPKPEPKSPVPAKILPKQDSDEEYAKKLQEQMDEEIAKDVAKNDQIHQISDEEIAKKLQAKYNEEHRKHEEYQKQLYSKPFVVLPPNPGVVPPVNPVVVPPVNPVVVTPSNPGVVPPAYPDVVPPANLVVVLPPNPGVVPPSNPVVVPPSNPGVLSSNPNPGVPVSIVTNPNFTGSQPAVVPNPNSGSQPPIFIKPNSPTQIDPLNPPIAAAPANPNPQPPLTKAEQDILNLIMMTEKNETPVTQKLPSPPPSPFIQIEKICTEISENILINPSFSATKAFSAVDPKMHQQVLYLLNEIIIEFEKRHPVSQKIMYGSPVPAYFANVKEQSNSDRKYLSLLGIRNLMKYGPSLIDDFRNAKFLGGQHHYFSNVGLNKFQEFTGNLVDLDIEIDAKSDEEALIEANKMIIEFGKAYGLRKSGGGELTAGDVANLLPNRKLHLPKSAHSIHNATDHKDRSNHGIWKRVNPKTLETRYHVNVPNFDTVLIATLRSPYLLAELAYRTKEKNKGILPKDFFDELFSKGISDQCFNDKARVLMQFYCEWNAKLDGVLNPEDDARQKIAKGVFGETLRQKGANVALKEAFTRNSLIDLLTDKFDFECKKTTSLQDWLQTNETKVRDILVKNNLWETTLFHNDMGEDYFLLNQSTLKVFLSHFHKYLQTMDF